jgi:hypothetical protein
MKQIPVTAVTATVLHINCILWQHDVTVHKFADVYQHSTFTHIYFKIMVSSTCMYMYIRCSKFTYRLPTVCFLVKN